MTETRQENVAGTGTGDVSNEFRCHYACTTLIEMVKLSSEVDFEGIMFTNGFVVW